MAFSDHTAQGILGHITGKAAIFSIPTAYVALFTAVGTDSGSGFTEVSGNGYARVATAAGDWNAATGSAPSSITNANAITFPNPTADWGAVIAFGLYDAASAGNLLAWDYISPGGDWAPCTVSWASPCVFTVPNHGYGNSNLVVYTLEYGGQAASFAQSNLIGLLTVVNKTNDTFNVNNAGLAVFTTAPGSGMVRKVASTTVSAGSPPFFGAGNLTLLCA